MRVNTGFDSSFAPRSDLNSMFGNPSAGVQTIAMTPGQVLDAAKAVANLFNPNVPAPAPLQAVHDAVFGSGRGGSKPRGGDGPSNNPEQLSDGERQWAIYAHGNDKKPFGQGGSGVYDWEQNNKAK